MQIFGLTITRTKSIPPGFQSIESSRGWFPLIREGFSGAWQRNIVMSRQDVLTYAPVFACATLIASDIGKIRVKLVEQDENGIWVEVENSAHSPVLRKPNRYQIRIKFFEQWLISKLVHGNTYVLKQRDQRGIVEAMYVLDPMRVKPLVAPDGSVFYDLSTDNLAGLRQSVSVPAREIIHDVMCPLWHPLCGVSPITACYLSATQGINIQNHSSAFSRNGGIPSGIISWPDEITPEQATEIQERWEKQFSGDNSGRVAALGAGASFTQMTIKAADAQLIEQLKWTAENVCTAFHVPAYMIGVGPPPNYNNIEALNQQYYTQCLQNLIETIELLLDEGLELKRNESGRRLGTEFDLDDLLRMDTRNRIASAKDAIAGAGMKPNEARKRFLDLPPVPGGDKVWMQEQNWPLDLLAKREMPTRPPTPPAPSVADPKPDADEEEAKAILEWRTKCLALGLAA